MDQQDTHANQSISAIDQLPLLGYPEFSSGLQNHIRYLRLLAYSFLLLGSLLIVSPLGYQCWQQPY